MFNRPYGIALDASSSWMNNCVVGQVTPHISSAITYGTYIIFGLFCFIGVAVIWFYVPETKRLTLEEMDILVLKLVHDCLKTLSTFCESCSSLTVSSCKRLECILAGNDCMDLYATW